MTTGGTLHVELTEAYGLTRAGRYLPRPTELGRSTEMMELSRRELENREDYRRATALQGAEKGAPAVKVKAMPVSRPTSDPSPFSTWSGPWTREENWVWRRLSKHEKRDWSRRFQAWAEEWSKEGSEVPEPAHGPRAAGSKEVVEVDSEPADAPEVATAKAGAPLAEVAEEGAAAPQTMPEGGAAAPPTVPEGGAAAQPGQRKVLCAENQRKAQAQRLSSHGA